AGKRRVDPGKLTRREELLPLLLVEKIRAALLIAEEEPVASRRATRRPILHKRTERRDARARPDHDAIASAILGRTEMRVRHKDRNGRRPQFDAIGKKGRTDADALAVIRLITNDRDRQVNIARVHLRRRRDRVQPWHQLPEMVHKFLWR